MGMVIRGDRVRCANCGMIYDKPPAEQVFWIGVPFRIEGMENCPRCGSNAADLVPGQLVEVADTASHVCLDVTDPPRGGSGVPKGAVTACKRPTVNVIRCPFADHIPGLDEDGIANRD